MKTFLSLLAKLRPFFITWLEGDGARLILAKVFEYMPVTGLKAWILKYLIKNVVIDNVSDEIEYRMDIIDGKVLVKLIHKARRENNPDDYDRRIDDIFR